MDVPTADTPAAYVERTRLPLHALRWLTFICS